MIVFQVLNFDRVKEILRIRCHIYIFMKKVVILREMHVKMKSFTPPQKETKHPRLGCPFITYGITTGNLDWRKCQKRPLEVFCEKRCFLIFLKFCKNTFLQNNSRQLLLKCGHCKNEAKEIDRLCCREIDVILIVSAKIPERKKIVSLSSFCGHLCPTISLTFQSYLPGGSVFLLVTGVAERNKKQGWVNLRF